MFLLFESFFKILKKSLRKHDFLQQKVYFFSFTVWLKARVADGAFTLEIWPVADFLLVWSVPRKRY